MKTPNYARIKHCLRRAAQGQELTIGFLGGSITQGSLAERPENTYAYRVYQWWVDTFPQTTFHYVNGGIGGTSSHYGAARAVTDLLMYQPDFVVVDFSVNDTLLSFCQETYEGVVRKILSWPSHPALVLLNNVYYDTGVNAQTEHNAVGEWYGVPHVSIRDTVYLELKAGRYTLPQISPDGLHPNDFGHGLVAAELCKLLSAVNAQRDEEEAEPVFPAPLTANAYESARRLTIREISPHLEGFRADTNEKLGHLDHWKNGWIGAHPGDKITFTVEASCIAVQYRKTIRRPALQAQLILDGDTTLPVFLDGNFDEDWGDCLYLEPVLHHGEHKTHTVELTILPTDATDATPFYLMALITA
ncbi:MAG: SGNH/GDSL hydrolase family protein [Faecalibacterium sp.]